jgi:hypothetical protein
MYAGDSLQSIKKHNCEHFTLNVLNFSPNSNVFTKILPTFVLKENFQVPNKLLIDLPSLR